MTRPSTLPADLLVFTTTERAPLYTALLYAFGEANERLVTSLALDDVHAYLRTVGWQDPVVDDDLVRALDQLGTWRLVAAGQNHAEQYRTAHEYERRNLQYALTRHGEGALAAHAAAVATLEAAGALQTAVLEAIAETLGRLVEIGVTLDTSTRPATSSSATDRRAFATLQELDGHLDAMRAGIRQFNGDLQRLLRSDDVDEEVFVEVKEATVRYLDEYVTRLDERAERIRRAVDRLREVGVDRVHAAALRGAELPPHPEAAERDARWLDHARGRWSGLESWFAPTSGAPRVHLLSATARRAIVSLLQVVDRMRAARRRPSSIQADLRTLARLFASAPTDADLHRLARASFGLHPARHTHLGHEDPDVVPRGASWADADPVPVSALLRESGMTEKHARPARVRDVAAVRKERAERARAERAATEAALREIGTDTPVRLSHIGTLDTAPFTAFLDLLGRAVCASTVGGALRASTSDGRVDAVLRPPTDGSRTLLRTSTGALDCPDYEVMITMSRRPALAGVAT